MKLNKYNCKMKKLLLVIVACFGLTFVSCDNSKCENTDSIVDTVMVDTIAADSVVVDTVAVDSTVNI